LVRRKERLTLDLPLVGLRRLSTVDFPGRLCFDTLVWGCNYRCPGCPSPELVQDPQSHPRIDPAEVIDLYLPRRRFLDGVSVSGGEPLLHRGLASFLGELRRAGAQIRLKTNASRLKAVKIMVDRRLVDWYTIFLPAPLDRLETVARRRVNQGELSRAIQLIRRSGAFHEFRVRPYKGLLGLEELKEVSKSLAGAPLLVIEADSEVRKGGFSDSELEEMRRAAEPYFHRVALTTTPACGL